VATGPQATPFGPLGPRNGIDYREAQTDISKWKKFMDEPTKRLDDMYALMTKFSGQCPVCEANMLGFNEHFISQKHFKKLREKFPQGPPTEQLARGWTQPWVQRIETTRGIFLHNHVTGEQAFESEIGSGAQPQPLPQAGPRTAVDASPMPVPQSAPRCQVPPEQTQVSRRPGGNGQIGHLHFQCLVQPVVAKLEDEVDSGESVWDATPISCTVCRTPHDNFAEHLQSQQHYESLQAKIGEMAGRNPRQLRADQCWLQSAGQITFNHLTGEMTITGEC